MSVAFVNSNTMVHVNSASPSSAFTINSGTNLCAIVPVAYDQQSGMSVSGVTLNGVSMTSAGAASHSPTDHEYVEAWHLVNPPTGSQTVAITMAGYGSGPDVYYNCVVFSGAHQTTPVRPSTYQNFTTDQQLSSGSYSLVVSSDANDLTFNAVNGGPSGVVTTNQTRDGSNVAGNYAAAHDHATTAAASVTHTWTGGFSARIAIIGFSVQAAGGGTTQTLSVGGATGPAGALFKQTQRTFTGAESPSGTVVKQVQRPLSAAIAPAGAFVKQLQRGLTAAIGPVGTLTKQVQRRFTASVSSAGALSLTRVILVTLSGALSPSGSLRRQVGKTLSAAVAVVGTLTRSVSRAFSAAIALAGSVANQNPSLIQYLIVGPLRNVLPAIRMRDRRPDVRARDARPDATTREPKP